MTATDHRPRGRSGREFVGRDRELAELVAGLEDALDGQGRLFLIAGEPGIGKTGLAEQLGRYASDRGARVVWGRCWEGGGAPPFWPWSQIVRGVAETCDDPTLAAWLGSGASHLSQLDPDLGARLDRVPSPDAPVPNASALQSDSARFFLFEAASGFLKRAAGEQPLLLVIDDLHAADDPSLLLLRYLVRDIRRTRLLVVATYRDSEAARLPGLADALGELVRDGQLTTLRGLSGGDVQSLMRDLLGAAPSDALLHAVHEATEGNPLFVREAVRLLASSGRLDRPGRTDVPIPGSVRALIQQRLAPLSADATQVLAVAAVVGRDFDLAVVTPACDLPTERVLAAVSEAMTIGVVIEDVGGPGRYRFSHSLMREVTYESLPIPVRAGLHRAAGEAIERLFGADSDAHVAELSRHFAEAAGAGAGDESRSLTYARRAGDRAMQAHAYEEAAAEYQRAIHALEVQAAGAAAAGGASAPGLGAVGGAGSIGLAFDGQHGKAGRGGSVDGLRCELLLQLGGAQVRAGRYAEAKEVHMQAAEIARRLGKPDKLARAALGYGEPHVEGGHVNRQLVALLREALEVMDAKVADAAPSEGSPLPARLRARLSVELTFSDEVHLTDGLSREAVEMARRLGDTRALGDALDARWMAVWGPDGLAERVALADEGLRLAQATGDRDLELRCRAQRVATSLESGDFLAVEADIAVYGRLADELRMPVHQWVQTTMRAMRALLLGSLDEAERLTAEAFAAQPERPSARWAQLLELTVIRWEQQRLAEVHPIWQGQVERFPRLAMARAWLALADIERGDSESARRALSILADRLPSLARTGLWLPGLALTALLAARLEDADAARLLYPAMLPYARQAVAMNMEQPVLCFGSGAFYLGLLAATVGDWPTAESHFQSAIRDHERLGAGPFLARTRFEYARLLLRRGDVGDMVRAHDLLARAEATARSMGLTELGGRIAALASEQPAQAVAAPASVLASAARAEGQSSAAAFARMYASPGTAPASTPASSAATPTPAAPEEAPRGSAIPPSVAPTSPAPPAPPVPETPCDRFQREGELWTVSYDGKVVHVKDAKGLRQLARLLAQPGHELHVTDLEALVNGAGEPSSGRSRDVNHGELGVRADMGDAGDLLDAEARTAYKARLDELQEEIDEAEDFNDSERAERAREEREFLIRELARAVGLGGRDRKAASHAERARLNATRAIRSAMASLAKAHPALGEHLAATVRTGRYCSYTPDPRSPVNWQL